MSFKKKISPNPKTPSPDGNGSPELKTAIFSCSKRATIEAPFLVWKNGVFNEDYKCTAGNSS